MTASCRTVAPGVPVLELERACGPGVSAAARGIMHEEARPAHSVSAICVAQILGKKNKIQTAINAFWGRGRGT
jgi:hypothetical protein